ncbi:hypothetical protein [Aquimarina sp. I32.4]|uniref:hypothetical protein n=1 Tax=Aquimarina sp. I32.4 TaxID=2053903 RepID=UPI000CDEDBDA|nr:hypothetical protein [Aquimarina sp. I32.4]
MRKVIFFISALLLVGTTAKATDHKDLNHENRVTKRYHHAQTITFVQGGVKFFIYTDGGIDYRILRRRPPHWNDNVIYNTPGPYHNARSPRNYVQYDYYGRVKKIGPNYISYDRYNRVRKIGRIYIRYNRRGLVYQIGGLRVYYKKYGRIKFVEGDIYYRGCGYCGITGCSMTHEPYYNQNWKPKHYDHDDDDDDHYYKNRKRKKRYHDDDDDDDDD